LWVDFEHPEEEHVAIKKMTPKISTAKNNVGGKKCEGGKNGKQATRNTYEYEVEKNVVQPAN